MDVIRELLDFSILLFLAPLSVLINFGKLTHTRQNIDEHAWKASLQNFQHVLISLKDIKLLLQLFDVYDLPSVNLLRCFYYHLRYSLRSFLAEQNLYIVNEYFIFFYSCVLVRYLLFDILIFSF